MSNVLFQNDTRQPRRFGWGLTRAMSLSLTAFAAVVLVGMLVLFAMESAPVLKHEGVNYVVGKTWFFRSETFGVLPMIYGTAVVAGIALLLAAPIGIGAAVFTAEIVPPRVRMPVKLAIELLAGIPSVVYGLLGILLLRNYVYDGLRAAGFDPLSGDTLLTAGLLLAVMILPTIMTLSDDALRSVPSMSRHAARGLGLTHGQAILAVSLPQARKGLIAAILLAFGRALGEAIAVFLVVGRQDNQLPGSLFSLEPLISSGQTLTSKLGGAEVNIAYGDPLHWAAVVGLGLLLLIAVTVVTLVAAWLQREAAHA
ncbi:phosphate ABC transporter permease subunit PstC [Humisphaera borealis]|nr:phosphate ABC transporter permease subunit PstC [Humisphaera borealis]